MTVLTILSVLIRYQSILIPPVLDYFQTKISFITKDHLGKQYKQGCSWELVHAPDTREFYDVPGDTKKLEVLHQASVKVRKSKESNYVSPSQEPRCKKEKL